jgi:hypothetical protein
MFRYRPTRDSRSMDRAETPKREEEAEGLEDRDDGGGCRTGVTAATA